MGRWFNHYERGVSKEIDLSSYSSINHIFDETFHKFGASPAFHNMGTTLTFQQLKELGERFGDFLQNTLGLKQGDRIAVMMPNILQYPVAMVGAMKAGLVVVNCNPLYTARELEHQLRDSGAKAILIYENSASVLEKILPNTTMMSCTSRSD